MPETRTIQKEDLLNLYFLNGAALSPAGSQVIYTVSKIDAENDKEFSAIHLLELPSGDSRQMTNGKAVDKQACWSPDGRTIAFTSDRSGKAQLYLLPADGGEARQITTWPKPIGYKALEFLRIIRVSSSNHARDRRQSCLFTRWEQDRLQREAGRR